MTTAVILLCVCLCVSDTKESEGHEGHSKFKSQFSVWLHCHRENNTHRFSAVVRSRYWSWQLQMVLVCAAIQDKVTPSQTLWRRHARAHTHTHTHRDFTVSTVLQLLSCLWALSTTAINKQTCSKNKTTLLCLGASSSRHILYGVYGDEWGTESDGSADVWRPSSSPIYRLFLHLSPQSCPSNGGLSQYPGGTRSSVSLSHKHICCSTTTLSCFLTSPSKF